MGREAAHRRGLGTDAPADVDWPATESALGTSLPSDFKEIDFVRQTRAADPDDRPVLVQHDFGDGERFVCGVGEFILRMLTDVQFGFPTSHVADEDERFRLLRRGGRDPGVKVVREADGQGLNTEPDGSPAVNRAP
ncbi:hypothetical protein AB0D12_38080 [Streptomyces sp. NPDC048479]|uniref:hypothetical protein n=1 Tax=Streptomyces sp. NPDC048479 TaxID=3154725 RepID=UPI00342F9A53